MILTLAFAVEAIAEDKKLKARFGPLYEKFGRDSTTKVEVVSGPKGVKMRNGSVSGKQWIATCGKHRFKLTIEDSTGFKLDQLVEILQKMPGPYMRACVAVSDEGEDGIAVYADLGRARAHGGKGYINLVPRADALVIAHEAGHTLEQVARESDPKILDKWEEAIKADKISVSDYGDNVRHEDLGEFAQVYAVCLSAGSEHLAALKKLSPARFALWKKILEQPPYDFYAGLRYPGAKLCADVDLYKVKQEGNGDPKAYQRREVDWWPRKGVDVVEVKQGMPLRTWTLRTPQLAGKPNRFEAHLVGFRGMGNTSSSIFGGDGGPIEPGVVLRLPDGRKRCFVRGSFSEEDKKYVMDLYVNQMQRIKAGLDKTKRVKRSSADVRWTNNARPGEPGTMQVESEHFIWVSGSQAGSDGDPWLNEKEPEKAKGYRDGSIQCAEYWWALTEYAGNLMPHWDRKQRRKYEITVAGTKRDGHEVIGGYAGGGYGGCLIKAAGGGPWAPALWHEWGHGALPNVVRIGGGEAQADTHQCLADPSMLKGNHHLKTPWRNIFNASMGYGYTIFYNITGDDPNWGYAYFTCLPYGVEESSVLQALARVGQQRGLFEDGIRGLGDMMGEYGARLATFDCELEDLFCRRYFAPTRSWLETVDRAKGIYRIPWEEAPEPFGVNIVRLVPDEGAGQLAVDFTGLHDPDLYSDWRVCIVAVGRDGRRRYSPMWNKGRMRIECRPDDCAYWLTVAATPTALYTGNRSQSLYSGRHAYRYPWSVQLSAARPGTPRNERADLGETALLYPADDCVPRPHDTAAGKRYARRLTELLERADRLKTQVQAEIGRMTKGRRHAYGGGWIADGATVATTAYVRPHAMVLGNARVLDHAAVAVGYVCAGAIAEVSGRLSRLETPDPFIRLGFPMAEACLPAHMRSHVYYPEYLL